MVHDSGLVCDAADIQEISVCVEACDDGVVTRGFVCTTDGVELPDVFETGDGHPGIR